MKKVLNKIRKCLALSKSDNPNEAAAALRQARALMAKHDVSEEDVALSEVNESKVTTARASQPPNWLRLLSNTVADVFGCRLIFHQSNGPTKVTFFGTGPSAEIAAYAFTVLRRQVTKARAEYRLKSTRGKPHRRSQRADDYTFGWVRGVRQQVEAFARSVPKVVDQFIEARHTNLVPILNRKRGRLDTKKMCDGFRDGSKVQLHHGMDQDAPPPQLEH